MSDPKPLPCPFCGGAVIVDHDWRAFRCRVCCDFCGTEGAPADTETEAIAAWNRRAPEAETAPGAPRLSDWVRACEVSQLGPPDWTHTTGRCARHMLLAEYHGDTGPLDICVEVGTVETGGGGEWDAVLWGPHGGDPQRTPADLTAALDQIATTRSS